MTVWEIVHTDATTFLATLTGLAGNVFDGPTVDRDDLTGWAVVGDDGEGNAGSFTQDYDSEALNSETGEVNIRFVARSGDNDAASLAALRQAAQSWVDSLRTHYKADKTLGRVLTQGSTVNVGRTDVRQLQTKGGALVDLVVAVNYFTRI